MGKWCIRTGCLCRTGALLGGVAGVLMGVGASQGQNPASLVTPLRPPPGKPATPRPESPEQTPNFSPPAANAVAADAPDPDAPKFRVGVFLLRYEADHPEFPALDDLMKAPVTLGRTDQGYVVPGGGVATVTFTLEELSSQPAQLYTRGAIQTVAGAVTTEMNRQKIVGVRVSAEEIAVVAQDDGTVEFTDARPNGLTRLTLTVAAAVVTDVRSVAFGDKVPFEERINSPRYKRIVDNSPIVPFHPDDEYRADLMRKDLLDDYVYRLNRQPGRRVDVGIAADEDKGLVLDYYVNENRPWFVYLQASNTGTRNTSDWRERFGFTNNQLTNHDDILSIDYVTAGFDSSHAVNIFYERPLWQDWLRGRVYGSYSEYDASDVGVQTQNFTGDSWHLGAELIANVYQNRDWFVDLYGGGRWQDIGVKGAFGGDATNEARDKFVIGDAGVRVEHITDETSSSADLGVIFDLPDLAGTDKAKVASGAFQRSRADSDWVIFQFDLNHSMYLEPVLIPTRWGNGNIAQFPGEASPTLAHEIAASIRGQHAFGDRLIPNFQQVVGGLYTVRGYPESISAGDSVVIGSLEYRFHVPQALGFEDPNNPGSLFGERFRYRPQSAYGRADWDLVLKTFLDAGATYNSSPQPGEHDDTLIGTGVGAEFSIRRNFNLRVDWGVALKDIENEVTAGSNRFHISVTILF